MIALTANIRWVCLDFRAPVDELLFVCLAMQYPLVRALSRYNPLKLRIFSLRRQISLQNNSRRCSVL